MTQVTWSNSKGGSGIAAGTTAWSVAGVALKPGANVITVTARDAAGNVATDSLTVTLTDAVAPVVTITAPTTADTHTTTRRRVALGGSASDLFGVTEVRWANNRGGAGVAAGTTDWSVPARGPAARRQRHHRDRARRRRQHRHRLHHRHVGRQGAGGGDHRTDRGRQLRDQRRDASTLGGTASDDVGVTEVTWTNSRGGSGTSRAAASWSVADVALRGRRERHHRHGAGRGRQPQSSATISVTRDSAGARRLPSWRRRPSGTFVTNTRPAVALRGTADDDAAVTQVTWQNSRGGSGVAAGTTDWTVPSVALQPAPTSSP